MEVILNDLSNVQLELFLLLFCGSCDIILIIMGFTDIWMSSQSLYFCCVVFVVILHFLVLDVPVFGHLYGLGDKTLIGTRCLRFWYMDKSPSLTCIVRASIP